MGLPYKLKADPLDGVGSDCILLTLRLLDYAGIKRPHAQVWWYRAFGQRNFRPFEAVFLNATIPLEAPEPFAVCMTTEPETRGFGVVVDGGLVTATHKCGVKWYALGTLPHLRFHRVQA